MLTPLCPGLQVGGSIPERANGGRLYNTCLVYGRDGRLLGRHRKVGAWPRQGTCLRVRTCMLMLGQHGYLLL